MRKKIKVLGTEYTICEDLDSLQACNCDGTCGMYNKEIAIRPLEHMLGEKDTLEEKTIRYKEVLRHELIHAFFGESGLDNYSSDETLVDWMAKQFPKMQEAMQKVEAL